MRGLRVTLAGIKMVIYRDSCVLCEEHTHAYSRENAFHISSERRGCVMENINDLSALSALFDKTGALLGSDGPRACHANRVPRPGTLDV